MSDAFFRTIDAAPGRGADVELEIRRSRFLTRIRRVSTEESARAVVEERRSTHFDARHHCSAFVLGPDGRTARSSDDGEPAGTAGVPMLQVLQKNALTDVVAVVTRYFGGVKLGAGGLVRAYTDTVAQALLTAPKITLQRMKTLQCQVPYALEGMIRREVEAAGAQLLDVQHGSLVSLQLRLPEVQAPAFVQRINDHGQGRVGWVTP